MSTELRNGETYDDYLEGFDPTPQHSEGSWLAPMDYDTWLGLPE